MIGFIKETREKVRAINERYAKPHIPMTRGVKISLVLLRGYLLFLVAILVYKFVITVMHK